MLGKSRSWRGGPSGGKPADNPPEARLGGFPQSAPSHTGDRRLHVRPALEGFPIEDALAPIGETLHGTTPPRPRPPEGEEVPQPRQKGLPRHGSDSGGPSPDRKRRPDLDRGSPYPARS